MKRIIAVFLLLLFARPLASCRKNEPQTEYINDRYFYEILRLTDRGCNVLVEFDTVTKTARIPCPDPLCDHGEGCVVSDISGCRTSRNCVYFYKDGFRCYNPARNEIKLIFESGAQVFGPGQGVENTVYFKNNQIKSFSKMRFEEKLIESLSNFLKNRRGGNTSKLIL